MIEFHDVYSTPGASDVLWDVMLERAEEHEHNISFSMPSREKHEEFISHSPYANWCLVQDDGQWLGYVSANWSNEVGIVLFKEHRGKGYGRAILEKALKEWRPLMAIPSERRGQFVANINPQNLRSIHLFKSLGFKLIQYTYELDKK
jgi:RimJ/RimL family protein N-acetyltransferase